MGRVVTSLPPHSVPHSGSIAHNENHRDRGKFNREVPRVEAVWARDRRAWLYMMAAEMENRDGVRNVAGDI